MIDNPKNFIVIILAFILSLALIIDTTRKFEAESERNSTFTISVKQGTLGSINPGGTITPPSTTPSNVSPAPLTPAPKTDFVIYLTKNGFSPQNLTIKAGKSVRFVNNSNVSMWIINPPSPATGLSEFNQSKSVGRDGSYDFTFNRKGVFIYQNNNNKSQTGLIIVE